MAQTWVPNWRKRLMLATLSAVSRVLRLAPGSGGQPAPVRSVQRILVIELWNIGDVVLVLPFLAQLRALFPAARISMLARPHARTLLDGTGLVDEFIETDLGWTEEDAGSYSPGYRWRELSRLRGELKPRRFDIAFKARMHIREHAILALSGACRRVAFAFGTGDAVLTDPIPVGDPNRQKALDWLRLLDPFGGARSIPEPRLRVSDAEQSWAASYLRDRGISSDDLIVGIHPGGSIAAKRWPLDRFEAIARSLRSRRNVKVLAFAEPGGYGSSIVDDDDVMIATDLGLRELMALIERCCVLLCNDSGPMHIAGGLGVPVVAIFGSGIAKWFSPLGSGHLFVMRDAESVPTTVAGVGGATYDVSEVSVERVRDAVERALAGKVSRG